MTNENILLAEFMNRKFKAYKENSCVGIEFITHKDCKEFIDQSILYRDYVPQLFYDDLGDYAVNWNSLMSIVEKIEQLRDEYGNVIAYVGFGPKYCEIQVIDRVFECEAETKILAVFNACVEFVKWFNNKTDRNEHSK